MKKLCLAAAVLAVAAFSHAGDTILEGIQAGVLIGGAAPLGGDSFVEALLDPASTTPNSYKEDFKAGFAWGFYAAGPISGLVGWRGELARDSVPFKKTTRVLADEFDSFDANHHVFRFAWGIQIAPWESTAKGKPYGFVTMGLARESASVDTKKGNATTHFDLGATNNFGLSFGGGYNYKIRQNWGVGGDLHVNVGSFKDTTRWSWTPSAVGFYQF